MSPLRQLKSHRATISWRGFPPSRPPPQAKPEDAAAKIRQEIETAGLGIVGLQVAYAEGKCTLAGECPSAEAMQKAVLIAGNVQGVPRVNISGLKVPPPKEKVVWRLSSRDAMSCCQAR